MWDAAAAASLQLCPTLCDPTRLPRPWDFPSKNTGVGCHFLLQCIKVKSESEGTQSCPTLATPWTVAYQTPLSMGFSRQEYWSGVPLPSPLMRVSLIQSIADLNTTKRLGKRASRLTTWYGTLVFSSLWTHTETLAFLRSWACQLWHWDFCHWLSWFSSQWTQTGTTQWLS